MDAVLLRVVPEYVGLRNQFCGFCFQGMWDNDHAHDHVRYCARNPNPGQHFAMGPQQIAEAKKRVQIDQLRSLIQVCYLPDRRQTAELTLFHFAVKLAFAGSTFTCRPSSLRS